MRNRTIGTFLTLAGVVVLARHAGAPAAPAAASAAPPAATTNPPVITRLAGRDGALTITATGQGPAYTLTDPQGKTLLSHAPKAALKALRPDLHDHVENGVADLNADARIDTAPLLGGF